jgi:hypothetical protein
VRRMSYIVTGPKKWAKKPVGRLVLVSKCLWKSFGRDPGNVLQAPREMGGGERCNQQRHQRPGSRCFILLPPLICGMTALRREWKMLRGVRLSQIYVIHQLCLTVSSSNSMILLIQDQPFSSLISPTPCILSRCCQLPMEALASACCRPESGFCGGRFCSQ